MSGGCGGDGGAGFFWGTRAPAAQVTLWQDFQNLGKKDDLVEVAIHHWTRLVSIALENPSGFKRFCFP